MSQSGHTSEPPFVLVVDDDPETRTFVCDVLALAGYRTETAEDGEKALALAEKRRPDLIVLDIMMRVMDGYTTMTRLRARPEMRNIPVIVLTGQEEPIYRTLSKGVGAAAHLTKPFSPGELTHTVQRLLGERRA